MEYSNPFAVVWDQAKKAGFRVCVVPLAVVAVYFFLMAGARSLGFDPTSSDPTGVVTLSASIVVMALVVSIPYVVFFRPLGQLQSVDEQRGLIAEVLDERLDVQSRMILHGPGERERLLIERLDQVMEEITALRREIRAVGSD